MDYRRTGKKFTDTVDELLGFAKIERNLKKKHTRNISAEGLFVKKGVIVDATVVKSNRPNRDFLTANGCKGTGIKPRL